MWTDKNEKDYLQLLAKRDEHVKSSQRPVEVIVNQMYPMASFEARQRLVLHMISRARELRLALKPFDESKTT